MEDKKVLLKSYVDSYAKPLTKEIISSIRHMNVIEEEYKKADKIMREIRRKNKVKIDDKSKKRRDEVLSQYQNGVKQVNNVKKIKATKQGPKKIQPIKKKK